MSGFIGTALASLQSTDGPTAAAARAALVASCPRAASPSFHAVFTTQLCNAALAVLAKSPPMPVKVNLGVVMTAVGSNAQTTQLDRAVQVLLADRSDGVALAGIHAAQPLVVALITQPGGPGKTALFAAVVNAVRTHSTGDFAGLHRRRRLPGAGREAGQRAGHPASPPSGRCSGRSTTRSWTCSRSASSSTPKAWCPTPTPRRSCPRS